LLLDFSDYAGAIGRERSMPRIRLSSKFSKGVVLIDRERLFAVGNAFHHSAVINALVRLLLIFFKKLQLREFSASDLIDRRLRPIGGIHKQELVDGFGRDTVDRWGHAPQVLS